MALLGPQAAVRQSKLSPKAVAELSRLGAVGRFPLPRRGQRWPGSHGDRRLRHRVFEPTGCLFFFMTGSLALSGR